MYFVVKHVETGPSCSHELATFLKYHMTYMIFFSCRYEFGEFIMLVRRDKTTNEVRNSRSKNDGINVTCTATIIFTP